MTERCLEHLVEILVRSDPDPVGTIAIAPTDCAVAAAEADGPIRMRAMQLLEAKAGMVGILSEKKECFAGLTAGVDRKCVVKSPELFRPARYHKVDSSSGLRASSPWRDFSAQVAKRAIRSGS